MDLGLKDKKVLITGASQGIGAGAAECFASEGAELHLTARNAENLEEIAKRLTQTYGVTVRIYPQALIGDDAQQALADKVGDVDILINNAGAIPGGNLFSTTDAEWRQNWELKVFG